MAATNGDATALAGERPNSCGMGIRAGCRRGRGAGVLVGGGYWEAVTHNGKSRRQQEGRRE
jgi:hypothetical protein